MRKTAFYIFLVFTAAWLGLKIAYSAQETLQPNENWPTSRSKINNNFTELYGREPSTDAPSDGKFYGRKDGAWVEFQEGTQHAPADGNTYGSKDGAWARIDYNNLLNLPEIPTKTSDLVNDSGFLTVETDPTAEKSLGNPPSDGYVLSSDTSGNRTWVAPSSGGVSSWGSITGTLSDQTDLQAALDGKQEILTSTSNLDVNSVTAKEFHSSAGDGNWWIGTGGNNSINPAGNLGAGDYGFAWYNGDLYKIENGAMELWGNAAWGSITGTLSDQTDLQAALDGKENKLTCSDGQIKKWNATASEWTCGSDEGGAGKATIHVVTGDTSINASDMVIGAKYIANVDSAVKFTLPAISAGDTAAIHGLYSQPLTICPDSGDQFILNGVAATEGYPIVSSGSAGDMADLLCVDDTMIIADTHGTSWSIAADNSACVSGSCDPAQDYIGNTDGSGTESGSFGPNRLYVILYSPSCNTGCSNGSFGVGYIDIASADGPDLRLKKCIYVDDGDDTPDAGDALVECVDLPDEAMTGKRAFPAYSSASVDCSKKYWITLIKGAGNLLNAGFTTSTGSVLYQDIADSYNTPPSNLDGTWTQITKRYNYNYIEIGP